MRSAAEWLDEYSAGHRNVINERLHFICVPLIVLSILGLLWSVPVPWATVSPWLNWATVGVVGAMVYYFALAPRLAVSLLAVFTAMLLIVRGLASLSWPLWTTSLSIFAVAWVGQFVGHAVEGQRPSFFKDVQFLLIGPLWLVGRPRKR